MDGDFLPLVCLIFLMCVKQIKHGTSPNLKTAFVRYLVFKARALVEFGGTVVTIGDIWSIFTYLPGIVDTGMARDPDEDPRWIVCIN